MKKIFFLIAMLVSYTIVAQDNQPRTIVFKLLDMSAKPIVNSSKPKSNNATFNNFLQKFNVEKYEQLCSYSKDAELLKYYYIITYNKSDVVGALKSMPQIVSNIEERQNPISTYVPSDYMYSYNNYLWHLKKIDAERAWDITKGEGTIIAVVDTWFDVNHPDLKSKFKYDYDPQTKVTFQNLGKIANPNLDHGTMTSSCAGAQTDGGGQLASIGFNAKLIGYDWTNGVEKAHHASLVQNADVVSISWYNSFSKPSESVIAEIKEILDRGTIIVASAGNYLYAGTPNAPIYPFSPLVDDRIICVTSTDCQDRHYYYNSKKGKEETHAHYPSVTICAPGYDVMVAVPTIIKDGSNNPWPYYGGACGTSFATPIVAGVCALMKSINPKLTPAQAKKILMSTADPVADADKYPNGVGAGRVNAYKAVKAAGTRSYTNTTFGNRNLSAGYGFNLKNVKVGANSNVKLTARCEVNIDGTFEVPLGSEFTINIDENARSN